MLAELHLHTYYSHGSKIYYEGLNSPEEMVENAKRLGIGCMAVTDHDNMDGVAEAVKAGRKLGVVIIPGEEVTTGLGHVLALGIQETIPPRIGLEETLDRVHEQGGIAVSSHPFDVTRKGLDEYCTRCDAIEVFNALNAETFANRKSWKLAKKINFPMVAGSDAHATWMMGYGMTKINAHDIDSILNSIKKGRTELVVKYPDLKIITDWTTTRLKLSYADIINYMNKNYSMPKRTVYKNLLSLVNRSPGKIDYLFRMIAHLALGGTITYKAVREILHI